MPKAITLFFLMLGSILLDAQKYDYQWPMGYNSTSIPNENFGISSLNFSSNEIGVTNYNSDFYPIALPHGSSFICDKNGELLLITNNCKVFNKNFQTIAGSEELTPGPIYDDYCGSGSYPTSQSSLILPDSNNDSIFYVLHKDAELSNELQAVVNKNFYFSTIKKNQDGLFFLEKKETLLSSEMLPGKVTACIHEDKERWWAYTSDYHSNTFYKYLVGGQDTIQGPFIQEIGDPLPEQNQGGTGQTAFSPNAKLMAFLTSDYKVLLYDFDNESGEFSNYRIFQIDTEDEGYGRGLAFSFDSRFIYVSTVKNLYQIDLQDTTWQHIAFHDSVDEFSWPVGIGKMHLGPDCRIYVSPGSTTHYIHVIHQPNKKGEACEFEARALRSPTKIRHAFPNLPMYRFDGACDSTIQFPIVNSAEVETTEKVEIKVYPNPVKEQLTISFKNDRGKNRTFRLFDSTGRVHFESKLPAISNNFYLKEMPEGFYFFEIWEGLSPEFTSGRVLLKSGKLVKVE